MPSVAGGAFAVHAAQHVSAPVTRAGRKAVALAAAFGVQRTAHASAAISAGGQRSSAGFREASRLWVPDVETWERGLEIKRLVLQMGRERRPDSLDEVLPGTDREHALVR